MKEKLLNKLREETKNLINSTYKEDGVTGFVFKVQFAGKEYQMKSEYVLQLLLQTFCKKSAEIEGNYCGELFEQDKSGLTCKEDESVLSSQQPEFIEARKHLEEQFRRWILLLISIFSQKQVATSSNFNVAYRGLASIIDSLIDPDRDFVQERGKPQPKPKYSLPTQTHLVIFNNIFLKSYCA